MSTGHQTDKDKQNTNFVSNTAGIALVHASTVVTKVNPVNDQSLYVCCVAMALNYRLRVHPEICEGR